MSVIDLPPPDERGPWGSATLDCRACGHVQVSVAPLSTFAEGALECASCGAMAADVPWRRCAMPCACGTVVRVVLWDPVDIMPARWPCPSCGARVLLP